MMDTLSNFLLILFFLLLKGFFSGSEIALVNCDKLKMRHQAKLGNPGARMVLEMFKNPDIVLGTTLVGTNISTVTITTLATLLFIDLLGSRGDMVSVVFLTPFLLIMGEIVPKSVYQQNADKIAPRVVHPLRFFSMLFYPLIFVFSRIARLTTRLVGGAERKQNAFITRDEIRMLLEMSEDSSMTARRFDKRRVRRIIRFADTTVGEAMIPLAEVVGVAQGTPLAEVVETVVRHGYNRLPLFSGNLTNIVGVLTLDTWHLMDPGIATHAIDEFVHAPLYISPNQSIDRTLPLMQARPDHMAIVVDEFGSAVGILTMEDVFEEAVGEIDVGYDFDEYHMRRKNVICALGSDEYLVDGRTPLSQINDQLHLSLQVGEAHTVAGFIVNRLRQIPGTGASIEEQGWRFTVREADPRAVLKVHLQRM
ncbi:MAG: hemolysin family protein [Magnetococcus sp. WYHC-3]